MKRVLILLHLIWSHLCFGGHLTTEESNEIKEEIQCVLDLFQNGDASGLLDKTHESIFALTGGRENFEAITNDAVKQLMQAKVKFLESKIGEPTSIYPAGYYEVCFVPFITTMEIQGKKAKSTGFIIAARTVGQSEWKYLDGSGLRDNPKMLSMLFPELDPEIELPPNQVELI